VITRPAERVRAAVVGDTGEVGMPEGCGRYHHAEQQILQNRTECADGS
jgi:hypothetical protein